MKLLIPVPHPIALLQTLHMAQACPEDHLVLLDVPGQAFLDNSAVPLALALWEWRSRQQGGAFSLGLMLRSRQRLAALRQLGLEAASVVGCPDMDDTEQRKVASALGLQAPHVQGPPPAQGVPRLFASADGLACVAHLFRQVPTHVVGKFRVFWVMDHDQAMTAVGQAPGALDGFLTGLCALKAHVHVLRITEEGVSSLLLAREPRLSAFRVALQRAGAVDMGSLPAYSGLAGLTALLAHADVLLSDQMWVGDIARGMEKAVFQLDWVLLLQSGDTGSVALADGQQKSANQALMRLAQAFPFLT
jgi:hypothetical protein